LGLSVPARRLAHRQDAEVQRVGGTAATWTIRGLNTAGTASGRMLTIVEFPSATLTK
jgi:hypothetical protein